MNASYVGLTSTLTRLPDIDATLQTLFDQDVPNLTICLSLPKSLKFNPLIKDLQLRFRKLVLVFLDQDYGPVCKLLGLLQHVHLPNADLVVVDDDILYPSNFISNLLRARRLHPRKDETECAFSFGGFSFDTSFPFVHVHMSDREFTTKDTWIRFRNPRNEPYRSVHWLMGTCGILLKRAFFGADAFQWFVQETSKSKAAFRSDDVLISAYLASRSIRRMLIMDANICVPNVRCQERNLSDALSWNLSRAFYHHVRTFWDQRHHFQVQGYSLIFTLLFGLVLLVFLFRLQRHFVHLFRNK